MSAKHRKDFVKFRSYQLIKLLPEPTFIHGHISPVWLGRRPPITGCNSDYQDVGHLHCFASFGHKPSPILENTGSLIPGKLLGRSTKSRIDCGNFTGILKLKSRRLISFDIISWMLDDIGICMKSIEIGKQFSAFVCHLFACWLLGLQLEQKKWRLWQWPLSHAMSGRVSHFIMLHPNEEAHPIRFKSTWIEYDKNISKSYQNDIFSNFKTTDETCQALISSTMYNQDLNMSEGNIWKYDVKTPFNGPPSLVKNLQASGLKWHNSWESWHLWRTPRTP